MSLRERLKSMDLRITELSDYLQVSRPTMYKFIECYDNGEYETINKKVLKLFNYINENDLVGKKSVVNYILSHFVEIKELGDDYEIDIVKKFKQLVLSNPESKKSQFIVNILLSDVQDDLIYYLVDVQELLTKKEITDDESLKLQPYYDLMKKIKNTEDK